ncbi:MAG: Asp-tRNA(Asn)/Glu-tRNA(Gln) amidotransferase subunit GatB [Chloroflexi bacterium]|nr:Asp-tRNA(Asn)/Glu-tRNA(Gln) amidotransferase subunit GatB [Chloroflexota bacterium]
MTQEYEVIIGMEVHAQLLTQSKMFCGCSADYADAPPNTHVCPVCMALPGALPVINRAAVEATIRTGLALNCEIASFSLFARKNYFYPDLPKGYQISQYELPLTRNGWVEIEDDQGRPKRVRIRRAHLEEDTGKLVHMDGYSLVDLNRAGVPLLEIVTEADLRSAEEAYRYLRKLRAILRYLGVSTADMEKGAMRCEANLSVRPKGQKEFGTKVEIKNLNSFKAVRDAIAYEVERHIRILEEGGTIEQVTLGWDAARGRTFIQRSKEEAHDYRYFPEPDLLPLEVEEGWVDELRETLPELPDAKMERFAQRYGLSRKEAWIVVEEQDVAEWFEAAVQAYGDAREVYNWLTGEIFRYLNETGTPITALKVSPERLAELLRLVDRGVINRNTAKAVLQEMLQTGRSAQGIVDEKGLAQVSDEAALTQIVEEILAAHPDEVARYRGGKKGLFGWFMGQVMRATRGKANPDLVRKILQEKLGG